MARLWLAALLLVLTARARADDLPDLHASDARQLPGASVGAPLPYWPVSTTQGPVRHLLKQFPDGARRNQCDVNDCHDFSSISLLEAAYYRQYGRHVKLSEADLFIRKTLLSGEAYDEFCSNGKCELEEAGFPDQDLEFAIRRGVAADVDYHRFLVRYRSFREAEIKQMKQIKAQEQRSGLLLAALSAPRRNWAAVRQRPQVQRRILDWLEGRDPEIARTREQVRRRLQGFRVLTKAFDVSANATLLSGAECRARSAAQAQAVLAELDADRPVAVSMDLGGLKDWGEPPRTRNRYHAFTIVGERRGRSGIAFLTRNSWGGDNPDVILEQLCRVEQVATVRAPRDR